MASDSTKAQQTEQEAYASDLEAEIIREIKETAELEEALLTCRNIGAAVGMIMERHDLSYEDAFHALVKQSQNSNVKVKDLARKLIYDPRPPDLPGKQH